MEEHSPETPDARRADGTGTTTDSGDAVRHRIFATAAMLFRTKGYAQSTTRELAAMLGLIDRFHWNNTTKITEEQASEMAGKLGEMKMHLVTGDLLLQETVEASDAFLHNRKPREDFEEHW